jgi:type IV secretory pathway VirB6-like protein
MLFYLRNFIFCVAALLLLAGCVGDESWCLTSEETVYSNAATIRNVSNTPVSISGNGVDPTSPSTPVGGWAYTGIPVQAGDQISISATGSILVAMPYGLQSAVDGSSNDSYIYSAVNDQATGSYYANNGLGHQIIVQADSSTSYGINDPSTGAPFEFVNGQNIIVTTKDCATGDTSSGAPSKWTWSNWNESAVDCSERGTRSFSVNAPLCKAVDCCKKTLGICSRSKQWQCQYIIISSTSARIDQCGSGERNYNCEGNASQAQSCYNQSYYTINSGWCNGKHSNGGISVSDRSPGCSFNDNNYATTPELNPCGSSDTCWNIGGYRMYAFSAGESCPAGGSCVHLNQSSYLSGGKTFQAQGGSLYLKIIDENAGGTTTPQATIDGWNASLTANEQQIATKVLANENLRDSLYKVQGESTLADGTVPTNDGQMLVINDYSSMVASMETDAFTYSQGFTDAASELGVIMSDLNSLSDKFGEYAGKLGPLDDPWSLLSQMSAIASDVQSLVNNITLAGLDNASIPTLSEANDFKANADTILSGLVLAITSAQNTKDTIDANELVIANLDSQNTTLNADILAAANSAPNNAIGGYTTYVRSDPVVAVDGVYLEVIASLEDPNLPGATVVDLGVVTATPKDISITAPGTVWMRINDPDGNYGNNMGAYTVTVGKVSESVGFTTIFTKILNQIKNVVNSATQGMFEKMTCTGSNGHLLDCTNYLGLISNLLLLYMVVFGVMFLFGLIRTDQVDFLARIIKIGVIVTLISPGSFDFFNNFLFKGILSISDTLIGAATGAPADNPFAFLDQSIALLLLDPYTYFKMLSLMFQGFLGFLAFIIVVYGAVNFVKAIYNGMKVYVMAFVGLAICFALAPIFIPFILFKRTADLFGNWFNAMLRFAFEPVILFIGLIFLNAMLLSIIQQMFNFSACFKCTFPITFALPGYSAFSSLTIFCIPWFSPWGLDNVGTGLGFTMFFSIPLSITFCIVAKIMELYSKNVAQTISSAIFGQGGPTLLSSNNKSSLSYNPFRDIKSKYDKMQAGNKSRAGAGRQGLANQVANKAADRLKDEDNNNNAAPGNSGTLASVSNNAAAGITGVEAQNSAGREALNKDKSKAPKSSKKSMQSKAKGVAGDVAAGGSRDGKGGGKGDGNGSVKGKGDSSPKTSKPRGGAITTAKK